MSNDASRAQWHPETSDTFLKSLANQQVAILTTAVREATIMGTLKVINDDSLIVDRMGTQVLVFRQAIVAVYQAGRG